MKLLTRTEQTAPESKTYAELESDAVAYAVPAHMMVLAFNECLRKGWTMRMDVHQKLDMSAGVPLVGFDPLSIMRLATKIDAIATELLRELNPDNEVDALHTVAMFTLQLIDEGLLKDATAIVVVVALLLMEDIKQGNEDWPFKEKYLRAQGKLLLHKATRAGLYQRRMTDELFSMKGD